jgi:hypothetical protein
MFDRRLLVICIVATAMYVAPVLAQFFLALCSWSIIILGSDDFTPFTITMYLWAVEFYYTTEYTSVLVVLYISAFTAYYDDPVPTYSLAAQLTKHSSGHDTPDFLRQWRTLCYMLPVKQQLTRHEPEWLYADLSV